MDLKKKTFLFDFVIAVLFFFFLDWASYHLKKWDFILYLFGSYLVIEWNDLTDSQGYRFEYLMKVQTVIYGDSLVFDSFNQRPQNMRKW